MVADRTKRDGNGATMVLRIADELRERVLRGNLKPGQRLKIDELSDLLKVSHMPVRGALQQLEAEGLLDVFPHRGTVIRGVDERYVRNFYDIRGAIEGMLAERYALLADDRGIVMLKEAAETFERAIRRNERQATLSADFAFHNHINQAAENNDALRVLQQGRLLVHALRLRVGYQPDRTRTLASEHSAIVDAIARRDAKLTGHLVVQHCEGARDEMISLLT